MRSMTANTTGSFGSRLRKLATSLSATSQAGVINEYVVRFFSTTPADRIQLQQQILQQQRKSQKENSGNTTTKRKSSTESSSASSSTSENHHHTSSSSKNKRKSHGNSSNNNKTNSNNKRTSPDTTNVNTDINVDDEPNDSCNHSTTLHSASSMRREHGYDRSLSDHGLGISTVNAHLIHDDENEATVMSDNTNNATSNELGSKTMKSLPDSIEIQNVADIATNAALAAASGGESNILNLDDNNNDYYSQEENIADEHQRTAQEQYYQSLRPSGGSRDHHHHHHHHHEHHHAISRSPKHRDTRTLVEVFDEIVGNQITDQPDDDVITIAIRNDSVGKKLFKYVVTNGEFFYLQMLAVQENSRISEQQWKQMHGAKTALDPLVREIPDARKIHVQTKEDLHVYYMPRWNFGVGSTLEAFRQSILDRCLQEELKKKEKILRKQKKEEKQKVSSNNHQEEKEKEKLVEEKFLAPPIPSSDKVYNRDKKQDVLSIPFEPHGMRLLLENADKELTAMNLHAISDKRQSTEAIEPTPGEIIAGKFRIDQKVGSATFSDAFAVTLLPNDAASLREEEIDYENAPVACIKVIKPEFFDQALDEVRLLNSINEAAQQRYEQAIHLLNEYSAEQQQETQQESQETTAKIPSPEVTEAIRASYYECGADAFHVVRLSDAFYFRHRMFVVTELLKENLYETTCAFANAENYWFDLSRLGIITRQITMSLELLHSLNLIHADLKPENIMVQSHSRCRVKLIDFGSSSYTHERFSSYVQSRSYRAPEVILGAPYDGRADVWSLGAVLVELASRGEILFRSTTLANMMARVVSVCGPIPSSLAHAGYHSDCMATRSGVLFSTTPEIDDERFEKFEQHPYYYTAAAICGRADEKRKLAKDIALLQDQTTDEDGCALDDVEGDRDRDDNFGDDDNNLAKKLSATNSKKRKSTSKKNQKRQSRSSSKRSSAKTGRSSSNSSSSSKKSNSNSDNDSDVESTTSTNSSSSSSQQEKEGNNSNSLGGDGVSSTSSTNSSSSNVTEFEERKEIWLHFPVFTGENETMRKSQQRQELWKKKRTGHTNTDWIDIYEHDGRIEQLLERNGGWNLSELVYAVEREIEEAQEQAEHNHDQDQDSASQSPQSQSQSRVAPEFLFLDFVKKCLILEPTERLTTKELLQHPFVQFGGLEEDGLLQNLYQQQQMEEEVAAQLQAELGASSSHSPVNDANNNNAGENDENSDNNNFTAGEI